MKRVMLTVAYDGTEMCIRDRPVRIMRRKCRAAVLPEALVMVMESGRAGKPEEAVMAMKRHRVAALGRMGSEFRMNVGSRRRIVVGRKRSIAARNGSSGMKKWKRSRRTRTRAVSYTHLIGAGVLIAEIQESSNLTYRMYDYNRVDKNGNPRELHIEKSLDVANLKGSAEPRQPMRAVSYTHLKKQQSSGKGSRHKMRPYHCFLYSPGETPSVFRKIREK